jgi:protein-S-isoprenylcysteine O-methyltransferase Ste14
MVVMKHRTLIRGYGIAAYLFFLVSFCYAIAFVGGFLVPRTADRGIGDGGPAVAAVAINTAVALPSVRAHSLK